MKKEHNTKGVEYGLTSLQTIIPFALIIYGVIILVLILFFVLNDCNKSGIVCNLCHNK